MVPYTGKEEGEEDENMLLGAIFSKNSSPARGGPIITLCTVRKHKNSGRKNSV